MRYNYLSKIFRIGRYPGCGLPPEAEMLYVFTEFEVWFISYIHCGTVCNIVVTAPDRGNTCDKTIFCVEIVNLILHFLIPALKPKCSGNNSRWMKLLLITRLSSRQVISSNGIGYIGYTGPCHPWGKISSTVCVISVCRQIIEECKCSFCASKNNLACKGPLQRCDIDKRRSPALYLIRYCHDDVNLSPELYFKYRSTRDINRPHSEREMFNNLWQFQGYFTNFMAHLACDDAALRFSV